MLGWIVNDGIADGLFASAGEVMAHWNVVRDIGWIQPGPLLLHNNNMLWNETMMSWKRLARGETAVISHTSAAVLSEEPLSK